MLHGLTLGRGTARALVGCLVAGLAACGGGGGQGGDETPGPSAVTLAPTMTLPQYQAVRASVPVAASAVPDLAKQVALVAANHRLVAEQMRADLAEAGDAAVMPPLAHAAVRGLAAAASGETLAEISSRFDLAPSPYAIARQTGRVSSQLWADQGRVFSSSFLTAADARGPWPRLASWSAAETGFAAGTARSDTALTQALAAADLGLVFDALPDVRLLVLNTLALDAAWPAATPFEGIFNRVRRPLLRLRGDVLRQVGADYSADLLTVGPLRLLQIRPADGGLAGFATHRLEPVLTELAAGLLAGQAAPVAGELLLPQATLDIGQAADGPLRRSGVALAYDKVRANLRGLDAAGGTYAQSVSSPARLAIGTEGLSLRAAHATAFTFSTQNVNGGGSSGGTGSTRVDLTCPNPVWPVPDLQSFFLALLDADGAVLSMVAVGVLAGTAVEPLQCGFIAPAP